MMINENSRITLHSLRISSRPVDRDLYAAVRWDTDDSILVGREAANVLQMFYRSRTVKEILEKSDVGLKEMISFLQQLIELNFVKEIDGIPVPDNGVKIHPWKIPFQRKIFRVLLNRTFILFLFLFILSGIFLGVLVRGYVPSYRDFFWTHDYLVIILSIFIIGNIELFLHELGHVVMTYAIGGEAAMRLSTRFIYLVAETESYHLAMTPKRNRYFVYLAGLAIDLVILSLIFWCLFIVEIFQPHLLPMLPFLKANVVILISRIIWQYNIFLETDLYNVISEYIRIDFMRQTAITYLLHRINRLTLLSSWVHQKVGAIISSHTAWASSSGLTYLTNRQKRLLVLYIFLLVSGFLTSIGNLVYFQLPREYTIMKGAIQAIFTVHGNGDAWQFVKSGLVVVLVLYDYILIVMAKVHEQKIPANKRTTVTVA